MNDIFISSVRYEFKMIKHALDFESDVYRIIEILELTWANLLQLQMRLLKNEWRYTSIVKWAYSGSERTKQTGRFIYYRICTVSA